MKPAQRLHPDEQNRRVVFAADGRRAPLRWLAIAAIAWLTAGCSTTSDSYGGYDYSHGEDYYVVDEVVYGGSAGYATGGLGYAHDPYWDSSGFAYFQTWPSYYVWAPYYDPFYVSSYALGPSFYYPPYRHFGGASYFGYFGGYADPWYYSRYGYYGHHGRDFDRRDGRYGRYDQRGSRYRGRGADPGRNARNEAVRLTTTRQPIGRTPPKGSGAEGVRPRPVLRATPRPRPAAPAIQTRPTKPDVRRYPTPRSAATVTSRPAIPARSAGGFAPSGYEPPVSPRGAPQPSADASRAVSAAAVPVVTRPLNQRTAPGNSASSRPVVVVNRGTPQWNSSAPVVTRTPPSFSREDGYSAPPRSQAVRIQQPGARAPRSAAAPISREVRSTPPPSVTAPPDTRDVAAPQRPRSKRER